MIGNRHAVKHLAYTCGLQATPIRPLDRDAWDLREMDARIFRDAPMGLGDGR